MTLYLHRTTARRTPQPHRSAQSHLLGCGLLPLILALALTDATAGADLTVTLRGAPSHGNLVFQLYDDPDAFGRFRDPARELVMPTQGDGEYQLADVDEGEVALVVYVDLNGNGALDRNFIGIPREPIALSNNYRPKGPPSFERASFLVGTETTIDIEFFRVLGERGQIGVGLGVIGRGSPYLDSTESVYQVIPSASGSSGSGPRSTSVSQAATRLAWR